MLPRSAGGTCSWGNVAAAHLRCNLRRQSAPPTAAQAERLLGMLRGHALSRELPRYLARGMYYKKEYCMATKVICQLWEERRRDGGQRRPAGYTLHLTDEDRRAYLAEYWFALPDEEPETHLAPAGKFYWCEVARDVVNELAKARETGWGVRFSGDPPQSVESNEEVVK